MLTLFLPLTGHFKVAEILQWLVVRYDPGAEFPGDVESEGQRVTFVKAVARFMVRFAAFHLA